MPPAARITDYHTCPAYEGTKPHVGGPINSGAGTVKIGGLNAARKGDSCVCNGPPDTITGGSGTVYICGSNAARMGDGTAHGGRIVQGFTKVMIGG